jgi:hypothetical protein
MISFNSLGKSGRLGNQMFKYAALRGIAAYHNFDFSIPFSDGKDEWNDHQLLNIFNLSEKLKIEHNETSLNVKEKGYAFDPELFYLCSDGVDLDGYFQTEKYFKHIKDKILNDFTFKFIPNLPTENYISIHVRRGDYLHQTNHHPVCDVEYYNEAISLINENLPKIIFSDDIEWCKDNIKADFYSENTKNYEDLYLMTRAKHNVIANSSFSWWGAWLNQNPDKIVVAPKNWFGPGYAHLDVSDLIPEEWKVL